MGKAVQSYQDADYYTIWCPGCECKHWIRIRPTERDPSAHVWHFNGNTERPSFHPSVKYSIPSGESTCHFFITDGEIQFQADCNHKYAAQNVTLLDFQEWPRRS